MGQTSLLFSLLFYGAFVVYLFFGIYILQINPKSSLNRAFLGICISLCFWSLGFAIANSAPDLETCLLWRRVSALGWSTIYSLMLHFFLLLTGTELSKKHWGLFLLLHLPAVVSVYAFAVSPEIAATQYHLVRLSTGWSNSVVQDGWNVFFNIYYISYSVLCLGLIWRWKRKASDRTIRKQANILSISIAAAFVVGSLTDGILRAVLQDPIPQMAPVLILMPIAAICYSMLRYRLMRNETEQENDLIINYEARRKLYYNLSFALLAGGSISALAHFLPPVLVGESSLQPVLYASLLFFLLGLSILLLQFIKNERVKETLVMLLILVSIPGITLEFIQYASITVWVFPIILMLVSLVFSTRLPLILLTTISVITQLAVWAYAPYQAMYVDSFDYIVRIGIFVIAFLVGSFVNRAYVTRLKENMYQTEFQKLISETSFEFVNARQANVDAKLNAMLHKIGCFFQVDRAYVFLIDHLGSTMTYSHEWCNQGVTPEIETLQNVPLDTFPWWTEQLSSNKLVAIEDVSKLPDEACVEKEQLTQQGVKSAIVIAIEENGEMLGFMGLDSVGSFKKWSKHHIELLKTLSNLLANGLIRIASEKRIEYMAYYDHLTGLPNRTLFSDRLTQAIHLAKRNEKYLGVIFIDLDSFKMVNDTMGHSAGDIVLKEVSQGLTQRLRKTDTVARFGGDEFLILINNLADNEDIIKVVKNILEMFELPLTINGQEFYITGSAGVAVYPFDGEDAETLTKNADVAMYMAKSSGKNQYALCTVDMKEEVKRNIKLSNHLYRAQERDELILYYQPQVELATGQIIGLEALLRWNHPEMGMIPPNTFIPLAEMNGTINGIGEWVLRTAVRQNKLWQDKGYPHLRMAVNLSVIQFSNPRLVNTVERILQETGLSPKLLELEITESVATKGAVNIVDTLNRLKQLGVSISIDDFGTEYSSLNRLKELPIDRIKIDKQFIHGIEGNEKDQAITKVIINLAKGLGLEVLAEGVETAQQLEFLNQKMCDEVQGYYYYKPMPAEEIEKLFQSGSA